MKTKNFEHFFADQKAAKRLFTTLWAFDLI